ncbi:DNA translocase FtsK 4TM domain-containing protein [Patescibacteria group bacterium]
MAASLKHRRRQRQVPSQDNQSEAQSPARLRPETKHGIAIVLLFLIAIVFILSLVNLAGSVGQFTKDTLRSLFGLPMVIVPVVLIVIGFYLSQPQKYVFRLTHYIGVVLFVLALTGFFHLFIPIEEAASVIGETRGGGYAGLLLSYPLQKLMGPWAAAVVLVALFIISLLLTFDASLKTLVERGNIFQRIGSRFREFNGRLRRNLDDTGIQESDDDVDPTFERREVSNRSEKKEIDSKKEDALSTKPVQKTNEQTTLFPGLKKKKRNISIPLDLLEINGEKPQSGDIESNKERIKKTLENFGIDVEMGDVSVGPTVTQYTLKPSEGVKLSQLTTLSNDLALALAAHPLRMEAPIPGKSLVGIEVPNKVNATVRLRQILSSEGFKKRKSNLTLALGMDVAGRSWVADLDNMPHLLLAGATGSGKSVMINSIIMSLLYQNSPDELKLILVDPKRVELTVYNDIPHLLTPVVTHVDKTINALRWVVGEMDRRFDTLSKSGKRDIHEFNGMSPEEPMPFIVVIIDELADLMAVALREVEGAIIRLAQMARAVGIHLIVATQRPSVDVITGLIKANITSRIAFNVASVVDSRTILDVSGAEKLLGKGDSLYMTAQLSRPRRLQGAFVGKEEIERVTNLLRQNGKPEYQSNVVEKSVTDETLSGNFEDLGDDELLGQAKDLVIKSGKASASLLQRRLRVGYARAARLLDLLEEQGVIGPGEGAKPREILISNQINNDESGLNSDPDHETEHEQSSEDEEYS